MKTHPYLQEGDLILTHNFFSIRRPLTLLSWIIRKFTRCYWNHVACVVEHGGELMVVEADWPRCTITPLQKSLDRPGKDLLRLRPRKTLPDPDFYRAVLFDAAGLSELGNRPGIRYDFWALTAQASFLTKKERKWKGRGEKTAHLKYYCSELGARAQKLPGWWYAAPVNLFDDAYFSRLVLRHRDANVKLA